MEKKRIIAVGILLAALAAVWLGVRQLSETEQITSGAYDYGAAGRKGRCTDS